MHLDVRQCAALGAAAIALGLPGCQARQRPARPVVSAPAAPAAEAAAAPSDQLLTVAFAQNALQAIELDSRVGALNNLNQAIGRSGPLQGTGWVDQARPGSATASMTAHDVNVRLISAKSRLLVGDYGGASAQLKPVAQDVPRSVAPTQLQLLRASGGLSLAEAAWRGGRVDDTRTELTIAASQLRSAAAGGVDQAEHVQALAGEISGRLASPSSLARIGAGEFVTWKSQVDGWLGGPARGASLVVSWQTTGLSQSAFRNSGSRFCDQNALKLLNSGARFSDQTIPPDRIVLQGGA